MTPRDGEDAEAVDPKKHIAAALGISAAREMGDKRPTLVYFHWPHEDRVNGRASEALCMRILNEEQVARWGLLFRCVQVDMATSDEGLTELLGAGRKPSFVVVNDKAEVVARIPGMSSSSKMRKALEKALKKCTEAWKQLQQTLRDQDRWLVESKRLLARDKDEEALELLDKIRFSQVRIGPAFDKAQSRGQSLAAKIERAREE